MFPCHCLSANIKLGSGLRTRSRGPHYVQGLASESTEGKVTAESRSALGCGNAES